MPDMVVMLEALCVVLLVAAVANEVRRILRRRRPVALPDEPESVRRELLFDVPGGTHAVVSVLVRGAAPAPIMSPSTPRLTLVEQSRCHAEFRFGTTTETDWIVSVCLEPLSEDGWSRGSVAVNAWRPEEGRDRPLEVAHQAELTHLRSVLSQSLVNLGGHVSTVTR